MQNLKGWQRIVGWTGNIKKAKHCFAVNYLLISLIVLRIKNQARTNVFLKNFRKNSRKKRLSSVHVVVDYPDTMSAWLLTTQTHVVVDYVDMCQRSHWPCWHGKLFYFKKVKFFFIKVTKYLVWYFQNLRVHAVIDTCWNSRWKHKNDGGGVVDYMDIGHLLK